MNLDEILSAIDNDDIKEGVVNLLNTEREKGITEYRKKDSEVLKYKNVVKELGFNPDEYESVDQFVETKKTKSKESNVTIATLQQKLDDYVSLLNEEKENTRKVQQKAKEAKLTAELTTKIGNLFYGANYLIKDLITAGRVDISEDGNMTLDGNDFNLDKLKEENKDMLRVTSQGGTGDTGGKTPQIKKNSFADDMRKKMKI